MNWLQFARVGSAVLTAAVVWLFAWPVDLGGNADYVVVSGRSMEPTYHSGDLVITHARDSYEIGEVVVYSTDYGKVVHRVIDGDGGSGYVLQGDNNDQIDQWRPTDSDVVGAAVLHVEGAGSAVVWLRHVLVTPPFPYLVAGFVFLVIVLGDDRKRPRSLERDDDIDGPASSENEPAIA